MKTDKYKILYNSIKSQEDIEHHYDVLNGSYKTVKGNALEYVPYEKVLNDGNSYLLKSCFEAKDEEDEFLGWHIRIKHDNVWYWYLEDGTLIPRKFYLKDKHKKVRIFKDCETIPEIPLDNIECIVAEAVWKSLMVETYFSFIVYVDNDELLNQSIQSIFRVSDELFQKMKLIVVDSICSETSMKICEDWRKKIPANHFCYISAEAASIAEAYNMGILEMEGRYVNFSLASTWFQVGAIETLWNMLQDLNEPNIVSLSPWTVNEKDEYQQYAMSPVDSVNIRYTVQLEMEPQKLQLMFYAYFFRSNLFQGKHQKNSFRTELHEDALLELLLNILAKQLKYTYFPKVKINYTVPMEDNFATYPCQNLAWWYNDSVKNWMIPLAEDWLKKEYPLHKFLRIALLYLLYVRFNCNLNDRNKCILNEAEVKDLLHLSGILLQYIDNKTIWDKNSLQSMVLPRYMRVFLLKLKAAQAKRICEPVIHESELYLWSHRTDVTPTENALRVLDSEYAPKLNELQELETEVGHTTTLFTVKRTNGGIPEFKWAYDEEELLPVAQLEKEHVILKVINYINGKLEIDGLVSLGNFFAKEDIHLRVFKDEREFPVQHLEVYGLKKILGHTICDDYHFHVSIPVFSLEKTSAIQFGIQLNERLLMLKIVTNSVYTHVNSRVENQYWNFDNDWYLSIKDKKSLILTLAGAQGIINREKAYQKSLGELAKKGDVFAGNALELRRKYFEAKEEYGNRRIWVTFDKLYKAGDNGEYIFNYISKQNDDIDIYYIIQESSPDYERLVNSGANILLWGEDETRIISLYAEAILTTHAGVYSFTGLEKEMMPYIADLFNPVNICIQHGLTTQRIAQFQNRLMDNLQLYICASPNEIRNLSDPVYGFEDKSALKLTGVPRYDGLKNNDQKQILITPTWRRYLANPSKMGSKRSHSDSFKKSEYFKVYNSLINDERLIKCAKKTGYKLIYLLHPTASEQISDFDRNDYVEIIPAAGDMNYEKILTESSLMLTDYSGVQFDFAYMKKPVLYYHPKSLPPHLEESDAFIYEKDAFGPLIDNHDAMVDALCEYMQNKCKMLPEYVERVNKFFAYDDFKSCERIYHTIREFLDEKKKI